YRLPVGGSGLAGGGQPGLAPDGGLEGSEDAFALLARGRDVAAEGKEGLGAFAAAPAAGGLLLQLDHAHVPLGLVVVEGDGEVAGEAEHVVFVAVEAQQQAARLALPRPPTLAGPRRLGVRREAGGDQRAVAFLVVGAGELGQRRLARGLARLDR